MHVTPGCDVCHKGKGLALGGLAGIVESYDVLRGDGRAVFRGRTEVPLPECRQNSLLNAIADSPNQFEFDHISVFVDGYLDDDVALYACGQVGARHRRIRKYLRKRWNNLVTSEGRSGNPRAVE